MSRARSGLEGPRIVAVAGIAVAAMVALVFLGYGTGRSGLQAAIRWTARSSFTLFVPIFAASALVTLRPSPATKWLLRNRRWLGLSLATSHGTHIALIGALAALHTAWFVAHVDPVVELGGGFAVLLLAAMAATSTDAAQARLGRRRWRALHLTGIYTLFAVFLSTYAGVAAARPIFAPLVGLLLAAWGLRIAAWRRRRQRRVPEPATRDIAAAG